MNKHLEEDYKKINEQIHLPQETKEKILKEVKNSEQEVNKVVTVTRKKKTWLKKFCAVAAACAVLGVGIGSVYSMGGFGFSLKNPENSKQVLSEETQRAKEEGNVITYLAKPKENKLNNIYEVTDELNSDLIKNLVLFSNNSTKEVLKDKQENSCYSPISLYVALAMCTELTKGEGNTQILKALGYSSMSDLQNDMKTLTKWLNVYDGYSDGAMEETYAKIKLANSFWVNQNSLSSDEIKKDALTKLSENYLAASGSCDFGNAATGKEISNWINQQTEGLLSPEIETDNNQLLILINTLYFYSNWAEAFKTENTIKDSFSLANGENKEVSYLQTSLSSATYLDGDGYLASSIAMNSGNMVFILPDEGITPNELLTSKDLNEFLKVTKWDDSSLSTAKINYKIPKFEFTDKNDLIDSAKNLGITDIFSGEADFSPIANVNAQISKILQESKIAIDENGCSAAAFTMAVLEKMAMPPEQKKEIDFSLTRPFIYIIEYKGMPLFVGTVYEP